MGKGYIAKEIPESYKDKWDKLADEHGSIFLKYEWGEIFKSNLVRIGIFDKSGKLVGGFQYFKYFKGPFKILINPPYTPHIGPFFKSRAQTEFTKLQEERQVIQTIIDFLNKNRVSVISISLTPNVKDTIPFYWNSFKVNVRYTYRIKLTNTEDKLYQRMSQQTRNDIRKAQRDGLKATESDDLDILKNLVFKTYQRQNKSIPWKDYFEEILSKFPPGQSSFLLIAWKNNNPIYAIYCVFDKKVCYNLIAGYDYEKKHHGAGALAVYSAILKAKELGLEIFDFEGSMVPSIERFFRGFGGELTPYYTVSKAPLLVEMGLKLVKRQIF